MASRLSKSSTKKQLRYKIWPTLYDGSHSDRTYEVTVSSEKELPKEKWKHELLQN